MSVVSETADQELHAGFLHSQDSQSKRRSARLHLISGLRDRGLKAPLKWSPWMSEVGIPDYREECRQLGDPMLFTRYKRLSTPLCKKEEGELFSDTNSPLATYSYHLKNDSRRIQSQRSKCLGVETGREVSISELHELMNKGPSVSDRIRSTSLPQFSAPHGLSIAIENSSPYTSIFDKLPKITLTIKQTHEPNNPMDKTMTKFSRSCESFPSPSHVKLHRGLTSFEPSMKARHSQDSGDYKTPTKGSKTVASSEANSVLPLHKLVRMSRSQLTRDWVQQSPLGPERVLDTGTDLTARPRKVRFGGSDWIYKDTTFMID